LHRLSEVLYPAHDGVTLLVVARAGVPVSITAPRTAAEAIAIAAALRHCVDPTSVRVTELAASPRLRSTWCTDKQRVILSQDGDTLTLQCYGLDRKEARELMRALDDALTEPLDQPAAAQSHGAAGKALAA
jgi:hypothetical protein